VRIIADELRLAATDVSNHLACRHLTTLELSVARGERKPPEWRAPDLKIIQELGLQHEARYLQFLTSQGLQVLNLNKDAAEGSVVDDTLRAMARGVAVIAQGALRCGRWYGRPDVLRRVERPSPRFGTWSYEAVDCKLARETKATTILQLSFYSELLGELQGGTPEAMPERMWVVAPGSAFAGQPYRVAEYAAYYRHVKRQLELASADEDLQVACTTVQGQGTALVHPEERRAVPLGPLANRLQPLRAGLVSEKSPKMATYPEPCAHCDVCRWYQECDRQRRNDDHLSLVAGIRRLQRNQLELWGHDTVEALAAMPIPIQDKPLHGSRGGLERVREQARVQVECRKQQKLLHELLDIAPGMGFCRLPVPSPTDMFVDLEGDPFAGDPDAGGGQEYLFGFVAAGDDSGTLDYEKRWALTAEEEKAGFEWLVDEVMRRWKQTPTMHVYHFGAYEPGAFKRLMGRYATREDEVDSMLRATLFVDLHTVLKQAMRVGVEEYSLKKLEALYGFTRETSLLDSREAMYYVEHKLQLGKDLDLPDPYREVMEGYNGEDCHSTAALRDWLESQRAAAIAAGAAITRPRLGAGAPTEELDEKQKRVVALTAQLKAGIPLHPEERTREQSATLMLANLLDWHRRENKAGWWEGYRLQELDDDELLEERAGLAGLRFVKNLTVDRSIPTDRYTFDKQDTEVRVGKDVYIGVLSSEMGSAAIRAGSEAAPSRISEHAQPEKRSQKFGCVVAMDLAARTIDIKKTKKTANLHPSAVYTWDSPMNVDLHAESLLRLGDRVATNDIDAPGPLRAVRDLLVRKMPRLSRRETLTLLPLEEPLVTACRIASALDHSVFAIQGPPGAGKTYTGARMICRLVREGKKVGITALSHKVIRKLLEEVIAAASQEKVDGVHCLQKLNEVDDLESTQEIEITTDNDRPLAALQSGEANVAGGTSWLWARPEYFEALDALFIDEAGQMALADVVVVGQAARNLFLIGDPQQLERPVKGSHPEGAEKSALEHLIGAHKTIPVGLGMLLPETWRMHPQVCEFTSEMFYEGRLKSRDVLNNRVLADHPWLSGAGLWFVPVLHEGNRNSSAEEVEVIAAVVEGLVGRGVKWFRGIESSKDFALDDVLIVAPYNAQVSDLLVRLPPGARVGTVDKFQGQEAPVVIYSLTTSSPEDAPRGMEFLYSLNRFNVATSRAMSNVIVVGSPRLFEPECKSPRQMQLANALCRYLEMATIVDAARI
jgi:predicted RecB family nuclease